MNWYILDNDDGESAHVAVWETVDDFLDVVNREVRFSDAMRPYIQSYEDGEGFHFPKICFETSDFSRKRSYCAPQAL
jgi:hypothetical protein